MPLGRKRLYFPILIVHIDVQELTGDSFLTTHIFPKDGVAKIGEVP